MLSSIFRMLIFIIVNLICHNSWGYGKCNILECLQQNKPIPLSLIDSEDYIKIEMILYDYQ